jgi:5'-nucleotidase
LLFISKDISIVGAMKPLFFAAGTSLREVNLETGNLKIETNGTFQKGRVYQGGSIKLLEAFGLKGNQVLYIGDHIYAG